VLQDGAFDLVTQQRVFPLVRDFTARAAEFAAAQTAAHEEEVSARALERRLYAVRAARAAQQPVPGCATKTEAAAAERALFHERCSALQRLGRSLRTFRNALDACLAAYNAVCEAPLEGDGGAPAGAAAAAPRLFRCTGAACGGTYPSDSGVCLVCELPHCTRCAQALPGGGDGHGQAHACNPDDVATLRFVVGSTRDCPRCHARITRASGCDQMMCTACNCVFNWRTGAEERGVIHNPHFHNLSTEARQRVLEERAARGIASTREQRFLAGVDARRAAHHACDDAHGEAFDPECEPFDSVAFDAAVRAALPAGAGGGRDALVELYRQVLHHGAAEVPRLTQALRDPALGERGARAARIGRLRGAALLPPVHVSNGHPDGFKSQAWVLPAGASPPLSDAAFAAQLMRADTARAKLAAQLQVSETFADAGRGLVRLLLGSVPSERPGVLAALQALADETTRLADEARRGKAAAAKKRSLERAAAAGNQPAHAKRAKRADTSDEEEDEEQSDSDVGDE
jgi:hypothetical protein